MVWVEQIGFELMFLSSDECLKNSRRCQHVRKRERQYKGGHTDLEGRAV